MLIMQILPEKSPADKTGLFLQFEFMSAGMICFRDNNPVCPGNNCGE